MSFIRTVCGDIPPSALGVCNSHDHVITGSSYATREHPDMLLENEVDTRTELKSLRKAGLGAIIDCTPVDCGRAPDKMQRLAQSSGLHLVMATGCHMAKFYDRQWFKRWNSAEVLSQRFISDITVGIVEEGNEEPSVVKAGLIKAASNSTELNAFEQILFEAVAIAHKETGAPILTHTEQGKGGHEQLDAFEKYGVSPENIILCHTDRVSDVTYHQELLDRGAYLEFDAFFRWKPEEDNQSYQLLQELYPSYPGQLLIGLDAARQSYRTEYGGKPGLGYFTTTLQTAVRRLIGDNGWEQVSQTNPAQAFTFR